MSITHSIMFHHFHDDRHLPSQGSVDAGDFENMLAWLTRRFRILDASVYMTEFAAGRLTANDVCLSFDDALLCQRDVAVPVLRRSNIKAFFFVYSSVFTGNPDFLEIFRYFRTNSFTSLDEFYQAFFDVVQQQDQQNYEAAFEVFKGLDYLAAFPFYSEDDKWFRYLRDQSLGPQKYEMVMLDLMAHKSFDIAAVSKQLWMTEDDVRALHEEGHVIGLHSHSHPTQMSRLSRADQENEYSLNLQHLERIIGPGQISSMSHPCGDYSNETLEVLSELGIRIGFRSSMSRTDIRGALEIPREDHSNVYREMQK